MSPDLRVWLRKGSELQLSVSAGAPVLHLVRGRKMNEIRVLDTQRSRRADRWQVWWDGRKVAAFSKVEQAVEAVDYEVAKKGRTWQRAAHEQATWREQPVPADLRDRLLRLRTPGDARCWGQALQLISFAETWRKG